jgi:hypothetical protein
MIGIEPIPFIPKTNALPLCYTLIILQAVGLEPTTTVLKTIVLPLKLCLNLLKNLTNILLKK